MDRDPSDKACIEVLRPQSVPENLVSLGVVVHVADNQLKLQLPGGVICIVPVTNISRHYTKSVKKFVAQQIQRQQQQQIADITLPEPPKLTQIFKLLQTYVCKIVEKRPRAGYSNALDIIASLDPSAIQEENLPKAVLSIPTVPLQCAIVSIEDHGYQVDIGFKNVSGFLAFKDCLDFNSADCKENKSSQKTYHVGQVLRCFLHPSESFDQEKRLFKVTMQADLTSPFAEEVTLTTNITPKAILPGSSSFLTVMKVHRDGLVVNFMNQFPGFVSKDQLQDLWHSPQNNYKISDKFNCIVLYYNSLTKTFALSIRDTDVFANNIEIMNQKYYNGKFIKKAKVLYTSPDMKSIYFKINKQFKAVANIRDALEQEVAAMSKDEIHQAIDEQYAPNSTHRCRIKSINFADQLIVVSLKQEYLNQGCISVNELGIGDIVDANVKKFVKDGLVVTFGLNLRAIILNSHLQEYNNFKNKKNKKFSVGQPVKCRVLKIDSNKQPQRVYMTNKEELMNPDITIIEDYDKSLKQSKSYAIIMKIRDNGIIVEFFNNVKGFIPKIFMAPVHSLDSVFHIGQVLPVTVVRVNPGTNSIILTTLEYQDVMQLKRAKKEKLKLKKMNKLDKKVTKNQSSSKSGQINGIMKSRLPDEDPSPIKKSVSFKELDSNSLVKKVKKTKADAKASVDEKVSKLKTRRQRSEEARVREENLRNIEIALADPNRTPQSISDFERLVLKSPNSSDCWIRYSKYFLENLETEKARIICRRALQTINFRMEKEKLSVWLQLIHIEAKYGSSDKLRATLDEAAATNDRVLLYKKSIRILAKANNHQECERLYKEILKNNLTNVDILIDRVTYLMEFKSDLDAARLFLEKHLKNLDKPNALIFQSKFAQLEFRFGDIERGKTIFENILSDNPKRTDLWNIYSSMIIKYGMRQEISESVKAQNEQILERIRESINTVAKKSRKIDTQLPTICV